MVIRSVLLAALAAVVLVSGAAADTRSSGWIAVYQDGGNCVGTVATTTHPPTGGVSSSAVGNFYDGLGLCLTAEKSMPPGYVALRRQWYAWRDNTWGICNDSGWIFNQVYNGIISHARSFNTAICGATWYGTMTSGYVWHGGWAGGGSWSNYHWMPS